MIGVAYSLKGEQEVQAGGRTFRLAFPINAIIALEEAMGETVDEIGARVVEGMTARDLRTIFWHGLKTRPPDLTEAEAGEIVGEVGLGAAAVAVVKAFVAAVAIDADPEAPEAGPRKAPAKAAGAGTGRPGTERGSS